MIASFVWRDGLRAQLEREAKLAYPQECCGLIEGAREGGTARAMALHPTRNLSTNNDHFEIDPSEHIRLMREARGRGAEIIGCYHSHPNGHAGPSERDREGAGETGFIWLIASLDGDRPIAMNAYRYEGGVFMPLVLA
ncbi:MAG TPA: M67 family metallopeptidase [Rhizomicrobium sp.]|jgi:proteasome lid subunit RPN8/RPN11|nr:M67 family metallopeptidase [Rhizomicrobium sp.]